MKNFTPEQLTTFNELSDITNLDASYDKAAAELGAIFFVVVKNPIIVYLLSEIVSEDITSAFSAAKYIYQYSSESFKKFMAMEAVLYTLEDENAPTTLKTQGQGLMNEFIKDTGFKPVNGSFFSFKE